MTSIFHSGLVDTWAVPRTKARNAAIDRTRTFLTLVVLIHHAVIPYTYFGHTDAKSWLGFDIMVTATDSFFMAMFFFLSGLFVWPGLRLKSPRFFLRDRLLRLGLPFAIAAFTVIPIAYYAIALRQHPDLNFSTFWWKTVTVGPWQSGPIWFVWVLLVFDLTAILLYRISPRLLDPISRLSQRGFERPADLFLVLLLVTAIVYLPALLYFGPRRWFEFGPIDVQASRVLLYAAYFLIGAGIGSASLDRGLLSVDGRLARSNCGWAAVALVCYGLLWGLIYIKRETLENPSVLPRWYEVVYGLCFVAFSAAILFTILAFFLRFTRSRWGMLDTMQADAYGMFLVHYPIVLWLQYLLFDLDVPALAKALIAFVLTVPFSWGATAVLRKLPGATRVL